MRKSIRRLGGAILLGGLSLQGLPAVAMGPSSEPTVQDKYNDAVRAVESKDYAKAVELLTAVIRDEPRNADALNYLGFSTRMQGKVEDSVRYYQRALAIEADHRGASEYLGEAYLAMSDLAKAEGQLAALQRICGADCKEYKSLAEAIAIFKRDPKAARPKSG
jgi:predicted Zn-dependent protease